MCDPLTKDAKVSWVPGVGGGTGTILPRDAGHGAELYPPSCWLSTCPAVTLFQACIIFTLPGGSVLKKVILAEMSLLS